MRARGWVAAFLAVVGTAAVAAADPPPQPVDIKPYRDKLRVFTDANGGVYAIANELGGDTQLFYGATGKVLYQQVLEGSRSRDGDAWSIGTWAPRVPFPFQGSFERGTDGAYRVRCGNNFEQGVTMVTGDKASAILAKAKFVTTQMTRRPLLLTRDDRGVYYYVDVLARIYGGNGHRLFIGKKGALKQVPMTDVIADSGGEVFATKSGDLRLVRDLENGKEKLATTWIRGEKRIPLTTLDTYMNQALIFRDLGVYKIQGTICGHL
ncbi:MAG: hypothetical protein M3680_04090 [Myxococcota bacterium]|nr:hypothetical protein [Myxococcota bacterium]